VGVLTVSNSKPQQEGREVEMRRFWLFVFIGLVVFSFGCSKITTIGREGCIDPQLRAEYMDSHPEGTFNSHIYKGEVKRGMNSDEVVASWGFPNVLLVDNHFTNQHWVYYT